MLVYKIEFETTLKASRSAEFNNLCCECGKRPHVGFLKLYVGQPKNWCPGTPVCLPCALSLIERLYSEHQKVRDQEKVKPNRNWQVAQPLNISEENLTETAKGMLYDPRKEQTTK